MLNILAWPTVLQVKCSTMTADAKWYVILLSRVGREAVIPQLPPESPSKATHHPLDSTLDISPEQRLTDSRSKI